MSFKKGRNISFKVKSKSDYSKGWWLVFVDHFKQEVET